MFRICFLITLICCQVLATNVSAGEVYDADVISVYANADMVAVKTANETIVSAQPGCATGNYSWAFSPSTTSEKMMLAILLSARITKSKVRLIGSSDCTVSNNKETITYVMLTDEST